jgi:predicted amidophosphoribosyltransferase
VCSQIVQSGSCPNWLCTDPARRITRIRAIAYSSGELRKTILRYKYDGRRGWSVIFGRLLLAWLDQNLRDQQPDLIIANPTFLGDGGATFGHTERVTEAAATEDVLGEWPLDVEETRALVKTKPTTKSAASGAVAKRAAAIELRDALHIPDPTRTQDRRILVYDDVCTTGSQLDTIAGYLIDEGGAADVEGIVLARAPWRTRT